MGELKTSPHTHVSLLPLVHRYKTCIAMGPASLQDQSVTDLGQRCIRNDHVLAHAIELPAADLVEALRPLVSLEDPQDRLGEAGIAQHVHRGEHQSTSDAA